MTVAPSAFPGASSASSLVIDDRTTCVAPQVSWASTETWMGAIWWLGGHSNSRRGVAERAGFLVSDTAIVTLSVAMAPARSVTRKVMMWHPSERTGLAVTPVAIKT